ncbi:hypothetical protein FK220_000645 [Flavobacteriaceae bacterium TP-CH-4]|uniref:Uncharacterized protein n=1 Tax=Pelagihabitans pacificus TaxID=2696054 RepID=A0A967EC22_9FLAO|nr:hypothetical protein [Pelagihabitans pacificus]NHF57828.1 hypothetical protein [Pelagihabitans pacificus]
MARDLRELFKEDREKDQTRYILRKGHEKRFAERLEGAMPPGKKKGFPIFQIAAAVAVLVALGFYFFSGNTATEGSVPTTVVDMDKEEKSPKSLSLGDLSPDLKKVEDYYVANINLTLAKLEVSEDNKSLVDSFMEQLSELNTEYERLNTELNTIGPNDQTINAQIKNLQLRLQLLQRLKTKLNELKTSKNEQTTTSTI